MQYLRLVLLPFSTFYGIIIWLRNKAYDTGLFAERKFDLPVISIGNLAVGGAGKSPMAEYIINLLRTRHKTAVLSRGYGRKTKGFRIVKLEDSPAEAGDEPLQFRKKFRDITVAVCEKRVTGIEKLQDDHEVIVLDDAYQHRAVKPGLNILLFDYTRLNDFLLMLPAGNLREPFSGRKRADIIVVTKTPETLTNDQRKAINDHIKPFSHQKLFFSYLRYENLISLYPASGLPDRNLDELRGASIFLLTGIANPYPLLTKLKSLSAKVKHYDYPDHHPFSRKNIIKLATDFKDCSDIEKIVITTEKDAQRLQAPELKELLAHVPVYYLRISAKIHQPDADRFDNLIEAYATKHIQHR